MTELLTTAQKLIESSELKPDGISYKENQVLITTSSGEKSFRFDVEKPRLAFAMVLALFEENDRMVEWGKGNMVHIEFNDPENFRIGWNNVIGQSGFGYERDEDGIPFRIKSLGNVVIGKNVEIGSNTCIDRGTTGSTIIGDYVKIDNLVHVGHNAKIGSKTMIAAGAVICGSVEIGECCFIGVNSSIKQHVKVGNNCIIGMGAIVLADVPDNTTVKGIWKSDPYRTKDSAK